MIVNLTLAGTPVFHSTGPYELPTFSIVGAVTGSGTIINTDQLFVSGGSLSGIQANSEVTTISGDLELISSSITHSGASPMVWNSGSILQVCIALLHFYFDSILMLCCLMAVPSLVILFQYLAMLALSLIILAILSQ